jgi:hypothetical protein
MLPTPKRLVLDILAGHPIGCTVECASIALDGSGLIGN